MKSVTNLQQITSTEKASKDMLPYVMRPVEIKLVKEVGAKVQSLYLSCSPMSELKTSLGSTLHAAL